MDLLQGRNQGFGGADTVKKNALYVVHMLRYGDREKHSYILGVFDKMHHAQQAGAAEQAYRGNKYSPDIVECVLNADMHMDEIHPDNWRETE